MGDLLRLPLDDSPGLILEREVLVSASSHFEDVILASLLKQRLVLVLLEKHYIIDAELILVLLESDHFALGVESAVFGGFIEELRVSGWRREVSGASIKGVLPLALLVVFHYSRN